MNNNEKDSLKFSQFFSVIGVLEWEIWQPIYRVGRSPLFNFYWLSHKNSSNYLLILIMNLDIFETRFVHISNSQLYLSSQFRIKRDFKVIIIRVHVIIPKCMSFSWTPLIARFLPNPNLMGWSHTLSHVIPIACWHQTPRPCHPPQRWSSNGIISQAFNCITSTPLMYEWSQANIHGLWQKRICRVGLINKICLGLEFGMQGC